MEPGRYKKADIPRAARERRARSAGGVQRRERSRFGSYKKASNLGGLGVFFAAGNGPLQALAALLGESVQTIRPWQKVRRGTALGPLGAQKPQESRRCPECSTYAAARLRTVAARRGPAPLSTIAGG